MLTGARHLGLLVMGSLALAGCLRLGYDALESDSAGSGASGGGKGGSSASGGSGAIGEAGDGQGAGGNAGDDAGGSGTGGSAAGTSGSGGLGGGGTSSAGSGGVLPPLPGPPTAAFALAPPAGDTDTLFSADASASTDAEDALDELGFEWDWESDGTYDDTGVMATHMFGAPGDYTVTLRVTDTDANTDLATRAVSVVAPGDLILITTGVDDTDGDSGGTGLGLREAIDMANATLGKQVITFSPGIMAVLDFSLPIIDDAVDIYGNDTVIDGSGLGGSGACFRFQATIRAYDLEIFGCGGSPITISMTSDCVVSGCVMRDNGIALYSLSSTNNLFTGNHIYNSDAGGFYSNSAGDQFIGNWVHDTATEAILTGGGADGIAIIGNLLVGGTESIVMAGENATIWNNTMIGASENGVRPVNATGIDLRNNIIVSTGLNGISGTDADFAAQDYNLFFDNASGACSGCTLGAASLETDPLFVDAALGDYRLSAGSPAINAGVDVGVAFSGSAPDLGYYESAE